MVAGEPVRITTGPLRGLTGHVTRLRAADGIALVKLDWEEKLEWIKVCRLASLSSASPGGLSRLCPPHAPLE